MSINWALDVDCSRCRQIHKNLTLSPLNNPTEVDVGRFNFWGMCPTLSQPLFVCLPRDLEQIEMYNAVPEVKA